MSVREHAKSELKRANFEPSASRALLAILDIFFNEFDSGGAVHATIPVLQRLLCAKSLSPLTGEPDEWFDPFDGKGDFLQNKRCSSVFKTLIEIPRFNLKPGDCYDLDGPVPHFIKITFPYTPPPVFNIPSPVMEFTCPPNAAASGTAHLAPQTQPSPSSESPGEQKS